MSQVSHHAIGGEEVRYSGCYRVEWRCGVGIRVSVLGRCKDVVTLLK